MQSLRGQHRQIGLFGAGLFGCLPAVCAALSRLAATGGVVLAAEHGPVAMDRLGGKHQLLAISRAPQPIIRTSTLDLHSWGLQLWKQVQAKEGVLEHHQCSTYRALWSLVVLFVEEIILLATVL